MDKISLRVRVVFAFFGAAALGGFLIGLLKAPLLAMGAGYLLLQGLLLIALMAAVKRPAPAPAPIRTRSKSLRASHLQLLQAA